MKVVVLQSNYIPWKGYFYLIKDADLFIFYPGDNIDLFTAYFPMQSAFILGAVYFNKNSLGVVNSLFN